MKYSSSIFIPNRFEAQQTVVYRDGHPNISINATVQLTSVDESKLNLIFCVKHIGCHLEGGHHGTCYCCMYKQCFASCDAG
jgi:hypothetical protein